MVIGHLTWVKVAIVVAIFVIILINIAVIVIFITAIIAVAGVVIITSVLNLYRALVLGEEIISGTTYGGKRKYTNYNTNYQTS